MQATIKKTVLRKPNPKNIGLIYDSNNEMARKTLKYVLSLGLFELQKPVKNQIETSLEEYRRGEYVVINKGKKQ